METSVVRLGLTQRQAKLTEVLLGEDSLGVVIRAHIHIEHELTEFIKSRLSPPSALDAISLNYAGRVRLALHLGLKPNEKRLLISLALCEIDLLISRIGDRRKRRNRFRKRARF